MLFSFWIHIFSMQAYLPLSRVGVGTVIHVYPNSPKPEEQMEPSITSGNFFLKKLFLNLLLNFHKLLQSFLLSSFSFFFLNVCCCLLSVHLLWHFLPCTLSNLSSSIQQRTSGLILYLLINLGCAILFHGKGYETILEQWENSLTLSFALRLFYFHEYILMSHLSPFMPQTDEDIILCNF